MAWRDWLPDGAIVDDIAARSFDTVIEDWVKDWFARCKDRPRRSGNLECVASREPRGSCGVSKGAVTLHAEDKAAIALADASLDAGDRKRLDAERDRPILAGFRRAMLKDLAERFSNMLGESHAVAKAPCGYVRVNIAGLGQRRIVALTFPSDLAARHRKFLAGARTAATSALEPRVSAIERSRAEITVGVGSAKLSLNELRALEHGDVVVLDRKLEDGAILLVGDSAKAFATGCILDHDGDLRISIQNCGGHGATA